MSVKIIDAPMGFGKTSAMINFMNAASTSSRFVFVTPYLDEGTRIRTSCPKLDFQIPESEQIDESGKFKSKMIDFKDFLKKGQNIVTTHALFERFDIETLQMIINGRYTLIMDEVADVASKFDISPYDAKNLNAQHIEHDFTGQLTWRDTDREYYGRFLDYKHVCETGCLWYYNDSSIIKMIPINTFSAFEDVYIMTYMFDAQWHRCYFDLFGIPYEYMYVDGNEPGNYHITNIPKTYSMPWLQEKIHIYDGNLNVIGHDWNTLSSSRYERSEKSDLEEIKKSVYNFLYNKNHASSSQVLWTCFKEKQKPWDKEPKERKPYFTPRSYASSFLSCNARATNAYRDRTVVAYPINRFMPPEVKNFFLKRDIKIEEEKWALSEMIQWIWRSAIRDKRDIWIYIPSRRMRTLLEQWIAEVSMLQPAA